MTMDWNEFRRCPRSEQKAILLKVKEVAPHLGEEDIAGVGFGVLYSRFSRALQDLDGKGLFPSTTKVHGKTREKEMFALASLDLL